MSTRRLQTLALVVLAAALILGTAVRLQAQLANENVQHDEAWSYASASGRLGPFMQAMDGGLSGRWVPARDWQYFWQSDKLGDLAGIGPDLAKYDVHPPLYFYLLHLWLMATGMHHWAGPGLNLIFAALAMLALFGLARALGFERLEASLVALVWALSPAVVSISALTRQYDLVALLTVLFVWGLVRAARPGWRWPDVVWLAAATCAALMTHYQTVLLVAGGVLFALAGPLLRRPRRPWRAALLGLLAGTALAAVLTPGFTHAFGREGSRLQGFSTPVFFDKLGAIGETFGRGAGLPATAAAVAGIALVVALGAALIVPRSRAALVASARAARPGWWTVLFFLAVAAGGVCLQNLAFLSLPPLITARYLAMAWPFAAFLPLLVFAPWPRLRPALTAALCLLLLMPASIAAPLLFERADRLPIEKLATAESVLLDNVGAGRLPRYLWSVPGDTPVFAGTQAELLANPQAWAGHLLLPGYYVGFIGNGDTRAGRKEVLEILAGEAAAGATVERVGHSRLADMYVIRPR